MILEGGKNTKGVGFAWKFPKFGFFAKKGTYLNPSEHKHIRKTRIYRRPRLSVFEKYKRMRISRINSRKPAFPRCKAFIWGIIRDARRYIEFRDNCSSSSSSLIYLLSSSSSSLLLVLLLLLLLLLLRSFDENDFSIDKLVRPKPKVVKCAG